VRVDPDVLDAERREHVRQRGAGQVDPLLRPAQGPRE
jgi:hypothetical protein